MDFLAAGRVSGSSRNRFSQAMSHLNFFDFLDIKLDKTCLTWIKLVQNGSSMFKLDKTCLKCIKLVQNALP